jgi:hypothetical protein
MGFFDAMRSRILDWLTGGVGSINTAKIDAIMERREYRMGMQRRFIRKKDNQPDDNIIMNFTSLAADRTVSMLFGKGISFDFGEDEGNEAAQEYIEQAWEANNQDVFLTRMGYSGAESGMAFVKIIPREGQPPRLVLIDPALIDIETDPDDAETIVRYIIAYKSIDGEGREIGKREVTEWTPTSDDSGYWLISNYVTDQGGRWQLVDSLNWEWDFPPIAHCQNLPNNFDAWGIPDITTDVIMLQDRLNYVASNISKVVRLYAHPQRWGINVGKAEKIDAGPDQMISLTDPTGKIEQLSPVGDMAAALTFETILRQSLFDITRTVDISSMADKLGALTNFGLHVLYQDAMAKTETKRLLYGALLVEINRRMLLLAGIEPVEMDVIWSDPLPENKAEQLQAAQIALGIGVVDKQTVASELGYDWEVVKSRLDEEKGETDNLGSRLLEAFGRGQ